MKKILVILILFCGVSSFSNAYSAENEDNEIDLKKIVVTASRSEENVSRIPKNVTVITRKDIEKSNAQTISDIIRNETGLVVRDYLGNGKTVQVDLRGFGESSASNILTLVDGRRVNSVDLSGTDWLQIPLSAVERIEILRGAGSVLYGDNAVGGVVNIITKDAKDKPNFSILSKMGSYQMYDNQFEASGKISKFSAFLLGDYFTTDGYRVNSELLRRDVQGKFGYTLNKLLDLKLSMGYHKDDYGLPGALLEGQLNQRGRDATIYPDDEGETEDHFANLGIRNDFGKWGELETNFSIRERNSDTSFSSSWGFYESDNHIVTFGFTPKYTLNTDIFNKTNKIIAGLDYYDAENNIMSGYANSSNDKIKITKAESGYYIFDKLSVLDDLVFTAGYRYARAKYNFEQITVAQRSEAKDLSDEVYTAGLNYVYGNNSCLFLNYSTTFRYPATDEFYTAAYDAWGGGGGLNTGLSTQTSQSYELGIKHNFNEKFNLNLTWFKIKMDNEIYYDPITYTNSNYPKTYHQGLELSSVLRICDRIKFFANYSCTDAEFVKGNYAGNKIPMVPVNKWSLGVEVEPLKHLLVSLVTNYIDERFQINDLNNAFPRMGDYYVVDLNMSYQVNKNFRAFFGVNNLFDQEYSEYGALNFGRTQRSFYPSPGRNFMGGVKLSF